MHICDEKEFKNSYCNVIRKYIIKIIKKKVYIIRKKKI